MYLLTILFATACSVGEYGMTMQGTDGSGGGDDRNVCDPKNAAPVAAHNHTADGLNPAGSRAGMGCIAAGTCHGPGGPTTVYTAAGTAFNAVTVADPLAAGVAAVGVTVRFFPRGGMKSLTKVTTDTAGNFYTTTALTFPIETDIAACGVAPSEIVPMVAPLVGQAEGNCSSSAACHLVPGPRPIYLTGS
jgi:hypothetical protein